MSAPSPSDQARCRNCGAPLSGDTTRCLRCALGDALEPTAEPGQPSVGIARPQTASAGGAAAWSRSFGDYELLEEVGRGGMGIVYRARQISLERNIAIKMLPFGAHASSEAVLRFRTEASAAGCLQHPNIVRIHEVGLLEGQHYLTMDFVEGQTLGRLMAGEPMPAKRAAGYLKTVAEAIHYAHECGILHRDLKPSNVLIDSSDQPRVTDFGLAKRLTGDSDLTVSGQVLGSPNYMPPEQADATRDSISRRSDVYSLGAMLYHLLTGRPPFVGESLSDTLRQLLNTEAISPRLLNPSLPRDLETICFKCLEKNPDKRYPNAELLAAELGRFLRGEPTQARPITTTERLWRWSRRHPAVAGLGVALCALLSAGIILGTRAVFQINAARQDAVAAANEEALQRLRAEKRGREEARQRGMADAQRLETEEAYTRLEFQRAQELFEADDASGAVALLARVLRQHPTNQFAADRLLSALSFRNFALPLNNPPFRSVQPYSLKGGRMMVAAGATYAPARSFQVLSNVLARGDPIKEHFFIPPGQFSPDLRRAVICSIINSAQIWDIRAGQLLQEPLQHDPKVYAGDGRPGPNGSYTPKSGVALDYVLSAQFSPSGQRVVTASTDHTARQWDAETCQPFGQPLPHRGEVKSAKFSPDGQRIVTASLDKTASLWDAQTCRALTPSLQHEGSVNFAEFDPIGDKIVTASEDHTARVWDTRTGQPLTPPLQHQGAAQVAQFSPDGQRVVTGSADKTARVWDARTGQLLTGLLRHDDAVSWVQFSEDGLRIATAAGRRARVWDAMTGEPLTEPILHEAEVRHVEFSGDGQRLFAALWDGSPRVWIWDIRLGQALPQSCLHPARIWSADFRSDGQAILVVAQNATTHVWDARTGQPSFAPLVDVGLARFSRDGRWIVAVTADQCTRLWDARSGEPVTEPLPHELGITYVELSPDGSRVSTVRAQSAQVWDIQSGRSMSEPMPLPRGANSAQFCADGKCILFVAGGRSEIRETETGKLIARFTASTAGAVSHFSSRHHVVVPDGNAAQVWDIPARERVGAPLNHDDLVSSVFFSADGKRVLTGSYDKTARIWDALTGQPLTSPLVHEREVLIARFNAEGGRVVTAAGDGSVRSWDARYGLPLCESIARPDRTRSVYLSPRGDQMIAVTSNRLDIWEMPVAALPVPAWFPELCEAVAGLRLNARGIIESVPHEEFARLKQQIERSTGSDLWTRWTKWFLADRTARTISFASPSGIQQVIERRVEEKTVGSLTEALRRCPTNALALARLATIRLGEAGNPRGANEADLLSRRAVALAPNHPEVAELRTGIVSAMEQRRK